MAANSPDNQQFVMHGARAAIAAGMVHIEEQVKSIERAVSENPGLAFDLARTLIESVCRTILNERGISFNPDDDLLKVFRAATINLPFLPPSASGDAEVRKSLTQMINGLHTAILGVCELRNQCGFASHGSAGPRPVMESVQAMLAAESADAIVGFLNRVHRQDISLIEGKKNIKYEDNTDFNEYVDDAYGPIKIFVAEFRPSEVLYEMEPESYRNYLAEFSVEDQQTGDDSFVKG